MLNILVVKVRNAEEVPQSFVCNVSRKMFNYLLCMSVFKGCDNNNLPMIRYF